MSFRKRRSSIIEEATVSCAANSRSRQLVCSHSHSNLTMSIFSTAVLHMPFAAAQGVGSNMDCQCPAGRTADLFKSLSKHDVTTMWRANECMSTLTKRFIQGQTLSPSTWEGHVIVHIELNIDLHGYACMHPCML